MGPLPLRCGSGGRRRIGALTDGFWSGGIRLSGLGVPGWWCRIMRRLRRWTRWWGSMMSCGWHGWPARSSRANLSRPARLPLVADQVSPAVTLAAMARQVFSLLPGHHPSVGAHRRPERVGSAFSDDCGQYRYHRPGRDSLETILVEGLCDAPAERLGSNVHQGSGARFDAQRHRCGCGQDLAPRVSPRRAPAGGSPRLRARIGFGSDLFRLIR